MPTFSVYVGLAILSGSTFAGWLIGKIGGLIAEALYKRHVERQQIKLVTRYLL